MATMWIPKKPITLFSILLLCVLSAPVFAQSASTKTVTVEQGAQDPAPSPDGKTIAVSILGKIWLVPAAGGNAVQLTHGFGWDSAPAWSADGKFLAYAHLLPSGTDLIVYSVSGGDSGVIYHTEAGIKQIAFSPKGGEIFFLLDSNQLECHLWKVPVAGGQPTQLTFAQGWHEWSFALSPDASQVLLDSGRYGESDLYLFDMKTLLGHRVAATPASEFAVSWTPDGAKWVFISESEGKDTIVTEPAGGGAQKALFSSEYDQKGLALFPGGREGVLCAGRRLFRIDLDSGKTTPIPFKAAFSIPSGSSGNIAIIHANLFDGTGSDPINDATIIVRYGKIASVAPGQAAPQGMEVIDAGGKFVMPGLMDNHYHYWGPFDGAFLLRKGITAIRDPGVAISTSMNFKQAIDIGLLPGPSIYSCGPLIDGEHSYHPMVAVALTQPESARAMVRALKEQGADALKVYFMLKPEVLKAVIKEAHEVGIPVTGHIGVKTGWTTALNSGIDGLNHIRVWPDFLPLSEQPQGENESLDGSKHMIQRMQADWTEVDPMGSRAETLIKLMADKKVGFDPTLTIQAISPSEKKVIGMEEYNRAADSYKKMGEFVGRAANNGVTLLAGTDDGSLHAEMEQYSTVGVPNKAVLLAATYNGAHWLHKDASFGTIQPGRVADIVIIDGDPLKQMKDIEKISLVLKGGRVAYSDERP